MTAARRLAVLVVALAGVWAASAIAAPAAGACGTSPRNAVVRYYRAIDHHRFPAAWTCLSTATRGDFGGYDTWRAGYRGMRWTHLLAARLTDQAAGLADLSVRVSSCSSAGSHARVETFAGRWSAIDGYAGWRLSSPKLHRASAHTRRRC